MNNINKSKKAKKEYNKRYWKSNKKNLLEIHQCETCGAKYSKHHKARHLKTKFHKTFEFMKKIINTTH